MADIKVWAHRGASAYAPENTISAFQKAAQMKADVIIDVADYARKNGAMALHPALYHMQDEGLIDRCKRNGLAVHVWTVNDSKDMKALCLAGVDALITNYPDIARNVVDEL